MLHIKFKGDKVMATVYCARCIWLVERGGVYYCGCKICDLYLKSVTPDFAKSCAYYKER